MNIQLLPVKDDPTRFVVLINDSYSPQAYVVFGLDNIFSLMRIIEDGQKPPGRSTSQSDTGPCPSTTAECGDA